MTLLLANDRSRLPETQTESFSLSKMVQSRGITVTVNVNDVPLLEYPDDEADSHHSSPTVINRYVQSNVGQPFTVKLDCDGSIFEASQLFSVFIYVDGTTVRRTFLEADDYRPIRATGPRGKLNGECKVQPMIFADIQISKSEFRLGKSKLTYDV